MAQLRQPGDIDLGDSKVRRATRYSDLKHGRIVGKLSKIQLGKAGPLRELTYMGFPIFWATSLSEKHPIWHWVRDAFLTLEVLNSGFCAGYRRIVVCVDQSSTAEFLTELFLQHGHQVEIISRQNSVQHLKNRWKNLAITSLRLMKRRSVRPEIPSTASLVYCFNHSDDINPQHYPLYQLLKNRSEELGVPIDAISLPGKLKRGAYSPVKVAQQQRELMLLVSKLRSIEHAKTIDIDGQSFPSSFLLLELLDALNNHVFTILDALDASKILPADKRYIYEDEVYIFGRVLSHFLGIRGCQTVGLQHGAIYRSQSIYAFSHNDFDGDGCLPLPTKVILWDGYFPSALRETLSEHTDVHCLPSPKGNIPSLLDRRKSIGRYFGVSPCLN